MYALFLYKCLQRSQSHCFDFVTLNMISCTYKSCSETHLKMAVFWVVGPCRLV
jgi:hypothetical protein